MEGLQEDREDVLLQAALLLLHGVGVEEEVVGERHQDVVVGADGEGEDVVARDALLLDDAGREDDLLDRLEADVLPVDDLLEDVDGVIPVAADKASAEGDEAGDLPALPLEAVTHVVIQIPDRDSCPPASILLLT